MGAIYKNSIKYSGGGGSAANERELTQAEYDLLTPEEKMNGTNYFITDGEGGGGSGGGGGVPTPTTADIGKVLTVNDNVDVAWGEASGGNDIFAVNFVDHSYAGPTPSVHTCDKTFAEVAAAIEAGKMIFAKHTSIFPTGQTTEGSTITYYNVYQMPYTSSNPKIIEFTAFRPGISTSNDTTDQTQVIGYTLVLNEDNTFIVNTMSGFITSPYYASIGKYLKYDSLFHFEYDNV